jgi:hypothetical protein
MNAIGWDVPRCYSGRPTRKQRRKEERYLAARRPAAPFQSVNREDVPTLSGTPTPTAEETLDALSAHLAHVEYEAYGDAQPDIQCDHVGINAAGEFELATHEPIQTITINGEQVPATIVKDPTK